MKKYQLISIYVLSICIFLSGCTKEVITKKQYQPPSPKLYGTWKVIEMGNSTKTSYYEFTSDNLYYYLQSDIYGFKNLFDGITNATDKQVNIGGQLYNYTIKNDTIKLAYSVNEFIVGVKVNNGAINSKTWVSQAKVLRSLQLPRNVNLYTSIGINGDYLYFGSSEYSNKVYKFNTLAQKYEDSIIVDNYLPCNFYNNGKCYYAFSDNVKLLKTTELNKPSSSFASVNALKDIYSISINGTSNTLYACDVSGNLYAGSENGTISLLTSFPNLNIYNMVYYKNDEFIVAKDGHIYKIKISPNLQVIASYKLNNHEVYNVSTNGVDFWAKTYNSQSTKYEFVKLNLD